MKFEEIYLSLLAEQVPPDDEDQLNVPEPEPGAPEPEGEAEPDQEKPEDEKDKEKPEKELEKPKKPKPLSEIQKLKLKWKEEFPGLTEEVMTEAIQFFNRRKNGLIEYKEPGYINPTTGRRHMNLPEIAALYNRFPELHAVLSDHSKIRDIQNYTWEQIEFYMDRVSTQMTEVEMDIKIEGDTPERQKESAYRIWENSRNMIVNERNTIVIKVQSKPQSIALGYLQHIINNEARDKLNQYCNNWCITHGPGEGGNLYYNYRDRRSYYFILDRNKREYDPLYVGVLQPIRAGHNEAPYVITPRPNSGEKIRLSWNEVVSYYPALEGKQDLFKYFPLSPTEQNDISVDKINFTPNTEHNPNPYDFAIQKISMQRRYIDSGRYINDKRAFDVLPHGEPVNLKKFYIQKTVIAGNDYKKRFRCSDPNDPLGILNLIERSPGGLYRFLDEVVLQHQLGITSGADGLKRGIVGIEFKEVYSTIDKKYTMYQQRTGNLVGIMDMNTLVMVKEMLYFNSMSKFLVNLESQPKQVYTINRYATHQSNDYWYFLMPMQSLTGDKKSPQYMKGFYFDGPEGDEILKNPKYRIIKGYS